MLSAQRRLFRTAAAGLADRGCARRPVPAPTAQALSSGPAAASLRPFPRRRRTGGRRSLLPLDDACRGDGGERQGRWSSRRGVGSLRRRPGELRGRCPGRRSAEPERHLPRHPPQPRRRSRSRLQRQGLQPVASTRSGSSPARSTAPTTPAYRWSSSGRRSRSPCTTAAARATGSAGCGDSSTPRSAASRAPLRTSRSPGAISRVHGAAAQGRQVPGSSPALSPASCRPRPQPTPRPLPSGWS